MPCNICNNTIKEQEKYYHSSGIVNIFLCKICGKCSHCHLGEPITHQIQWDKDIYDVKLNIIPESKSPITDDKKELSVIYDMPWR